MLDSPILFALTKFLFLIDPGFLFTGSKSVSFVKISAKFFTKKNNRIDEYKRNSIIMCSIVARNYWKTEEIKGITIFFNNSIGAMSGVTILGITKSLAAGIVSE